MNKIYIYSAFACAALSFLVGCVEENFTPVTPAQVGDEIMFGARTGFENGDPATRTVYSGETYTDNEHTFERIDWVDDVDMIEIYCPEAGNGPSSHYVVRNAKDPDTQKDYAYLERVGDSSLHWGSEDTHHFYAMYPSANMLTNIGDKGVGFTHKDAAVMANGYIHDIQQPASVTSSQNADSKTIWTAAPNMNYAHMVAKAEAKAEDGSVQMTFYPVVTTVEIELSLDADADNTVNLTGVKLSHVTQPLAGGFSSDLTGWDPSSGSYPSSSSINGMELSSVTIPLWQGTNYAPVTLAAGDAVKFTAFLMPGKDITDLTITLLDGTAESSKNLNGIKLPSNMKTKVTKLALPATYTSFILDNSNWMSQLDPQTPMKALSIPGTGGTYSFNYDSSNPDWYKQQTLDFNDQWKLGIRAFEIVSDRPSSSSATLGTENVKCNKVSMGTTVSAVLTDLLTKVAAKNETTGKPEETAILILTYQPEGAWDGWSQRNRNSDSYASSLKLLYDNLGPEQKAQIIQYKPDLTLADAKGKVMIICRINQRDESDGGTFANASETLKGTNITLIDGCGTGKDRWGSRGYKVNGNVAYDAANTTDSNKSVDYYLTQQQSRWEDWNNVTVPVAANGDLNFSFATNYEGITCWYQEWARVVPQKMIDPESEWYQVQVNEQTWWGTTTYTYRWFESYNEKLAAATETFRMAISGEYPNYIFINSLCGYFVDSSISASYQIFNGLNTGGIAGNIKELADELNRDFYSFVLSSGMETSTGPTGIVMMDYVSNKSMDGGSYYLPGVIIENNFKEYNYVKPDGNPDTGNPGGGTDGI